MHSMFAIRCKSVFIKASMGKYFNSINVYILFTSCIDLDLVIAG